MMAANIRATTNNDLATSDNYFKFKVSPKRLTGRLLGAAPLLKNLKQLAGLTTRGGQAKWM
jgi:hypothetical protein